MSLAVQHTSHGIALYIKNDELSRSRITRNKKKTSVGTSTRPFENIGYIAKREKAKSEKS